jgi:hypothetical protein
LTTLRPLSVRTSCFVAAALAIAALGACSASRSKPRNFGAPDDAFRSAPGAATDVAAGGDQMIESIEPWTYNSREGRIIRTPNYRIFTTQADTVLNARVPMFVEGALDHYRTAFAASGQPLPRPELKLDTFVLATRHDWTMLTKQLTGEQAELYLRIPRGGFAFGGKALLYDIGTRDTLAILSHEGWHQYTQRTFKQPLPIWLEEGLGTYMEGHRWAGAGGLKPMFLPWCNTERFDQLRRAQAQGGLMRLPELLDSAPQDLMNPSTEAAINYYAQVWALTHFLAEGGEGKYREAFGQLLADAAGGTMDKKMTAVLGPQGRRALTYRRGPGVFMAYFAKNMDEAAADYDLFVKKLTASNARTAIVAGQSPFARGK